MKFLKLVDISSMSSFQVRFWLSLQSEVSEDDLNGIPNWFFSFFIKGIFCQSYLFVNLYSDYITSLSRCYQMKYLIKSVCNFVKIELFRRHFSMIYLLLF